MSARVVFVVLLVASGAAACTGVISPGDSADGSQPSSALRVVRLSHPQWENTVQDLFGLAQPPGLAAGFHPDPPLGRFDNNAARLALTSGHWADYQRAAEEMARRVAADPAILARLAPADLPAEPTARARELIQRFGLRAFRRPLTSAEGDRYVALFQTGATHFAGPDPFIDGVRILVEAVLQSPHFVYRVEASTTVEGDAIVLSGYEVAVRLSYLLWNTMPDADLFAAAAGGELATAEGVRARAARMLDDPRARASLGHFHEQLFELEEYLDLDKDLALFPSWRRSVGAMMKTEAELFFDGLFASGGSVADVFTSRRAFVNRDLAALYGVAGSFNDRFVEVELDPGQRAGVLTRLGFLARNATLAQPDPIHRGVFANLNLLCRPLAPVPNLPDNLKPVGNTNRERINSLTGKGTCGESCHGSIINPIGFALESYDAVGAYRTADNGYPVEAADTYVFEGGRAISFQNAVDLSEQLAQAPEAHRCYLSHLIEYASGRDLGAADEPLLDYLAGRSQGAGSPIRDLVLDVVSSRGFRFRSRQEEGNSP